MIILLLPVFAYVVWAYIDVLWIIVTGKSLLGDGDPEQERGVNIGGYDGW